MSIMTQAQPRTAVKTRLLSVPLAVTFLAEFTSLTSFFLLLSVIPMLAAAAGAVLLGAPALAMLVHQPQAVMVSVSVARGFGFGLSGVVTGALTAKLLPPERRG
ncbi:MAG TPA: hypothetical protein VE888_07345, partial [Streptosporangiaceae bacterium]|nr:hypothetical protein [Streptosporangiaceae bacterium]